jgi:serine/threonine protein phosphatase PrpC
VSSGQTDQTDAAATPPAKGAASLQATGHTHVGHVRDSNEDCLLVAADLGLLVVADGMGGHAGGEVASALVVESVQREIRGIGAFAHAAPALALTAAIRAANDAVRNKGNETAALRGMGSTVVSALIIDRVVHVAHAGDSRAYRIRKGEIQRLTRDHSLVEEFLAEHPDADEDDVEGAYKHLVTRAVGAAAALEVDVNEFICEAGDVILLCSDGLTGPVEDDEIADIITSAATIEEAANELIEAALDSGGPDNVTVVLGKIS